MIQPSANDSAPPLHVRFFDLEPVLRSDGVDTLSHKNYCPVCKDGMLLMLREWPSLVLRAEDVCTLCGQRFVYEDIDLVRRHRP